MIGALRSHTRASMLALALAGGIAAMPDLGQQRTLTSWPGSGLVRATGRPKPRRDAERQMRAVLKRRRKDAKRLRDAERTNEGQNWACRWRALPQVVGRRHGK